MNLRGQNVHREKCLGQYCLLATLWLLSSEGIPLLQQLEYKEDWHLNNKNVLGKQGLYI